MRTNLWDSYSSSAAIGGGRIFFRWITKFPKVFSNNVWRAQIINSPVHYSFLPTYPSIYFGSLKTSSFCFEARPGTSAPLPRRDQFRNQTATGTTTKVDNGSTCLHNIMRSEFKIQRAVGTGTEVAAGHPARRISRRPFTLGRPW